MDSMKIIAENITVWQSFLILQTSFMRILLFVCLRRDKMCGELPFMTFLPSFQRRKTDNFAAGFSLFISP